MVQKIYSQSSAPNLVPLQNGSPLFDCRCQLLEGCLRAAAALLLSYFPQFAEAPCETAAFWWSWGRGRCNSHRGWAPGGESTLHSDFLSQHSYRYNCVDDEVQISALSLYFATHIGAHVPVEVLELGVLGSESMYSSWGFVTAFPTWNEESVCSTLSREAFCTAAILFVTLKPHEFLSFVYPRMM